MSETTFVIRKLSGAHLSWTPERYFALHPNAKSVPEDYTRFDFLAEFQRSNMQFPGQPLDDSDTVQYAQRACDPGVIYEYTVEQLTEVFGPSFEPVGGGSYLCTVSNFVNAPLLSAVDIGPDFDFSKCVDELYLREFSISRSERGKSALAWADRISVAAYHAPVILVDTGTELVTVGLIPLLVYFRHRGQKLYVKLDLSDAVEVLDGVLTDGTSKEIIDQQFSKIMTCGPWSIMRCVGTDPLEDISIEDKLYVIKKVRDAMAHNIGNTVGEFKVIDRSLLVENPQWRNAQKIYHVGESIDEQFPSSTNIGLYDVGSQLTTSAHAVWRVQKALVRDLIFTHLGRYCNRTEISDKLIQAVTVPITRYNLQNNVGRMRRAPNLDHWRHGLSALFTTANVDVSADGKTITITNEDNNTTITVDIQPLLLKVIGICQSWQQESPTSVN